MKIFALCYKTGVSGGYEEIIGIYNSMEELEKGKIKDNEEYYTCRLHGEYFVEEIEINKNINRVYNEW